MSGTRMQVHLDQWPRWRSALHPGDALVKETCPACHGSRLQRDAQGLLQRCPACNGSGTWESPDDAEDCPVTAPLNPMPPGFSCPAKRLVPGDNLGYRVVPLPWHNPSFPTHYYDPNFNGRITCGDQTPVSIASVPTVFNCQPSLN